MSNDPPHLEFQPLKQRVSGLGWAILLGACLICLGGCQKTDARVVETTGRVLFNGLPARAAIVSQPLGKDGQPNGRAAVADTLEDGSFSLRYNEHQMGTLAGKQRFNIRVFPVERGESELGFQERFKAVKDVTFEREVVLNKPNHWEFHLTY